MALYELEDGRLQPAQFGHELPDGFSDSILTAVRSQVLEIVSRPLFPIVWQGGEDAYSAPRLTALDAAGQVVAVEVVRYLDADILIEALSRLADSAAMSWTDLAREYPRGVEGFKAGWARFRESMPTSPPNGPRMVLVAAQIAEEVRPALDVLSSSGVEVHEMTLRQTSNGRVFLEVEPVGHRLYNHRFTPVVEGTSALPALAASARKARRTPIDEGQPTPDVLARRSEPTAKPKAEEPPKSAPSRPAPSVRPAGLPTRASRRAQRSQAPEPVAVDGGMRRRSRLSRHGQRPTQELRLEANADALRTLARMLGTDVAVALSPASRTPQGALLSLEGQLVLPAGVFTDPSQALRASGIYGEDGWDAWHLGDERGPTLRESIEELNEVG